MCYDSLSDPTRARRRAMRTRHKPEQIIVQLRQADAELAQGVRVGQVCQQLGISETTFNRWRLPYGGLKADQAQRHKELEGANARRKKRVAELSRDKQMLREVAPKKW